MLASIRTVLVHTSHPGNIGAAARALKTMGLSQLYLVAPKEFPHHKADEMAANAGDILKRAEVRATLDAAIADCALVVGTSSRNRSIPWPLLSAREMAEHIKNTQTERPIAILFGCEQSGLSNEELERCHLHVHIPANPLYSSLNLAAAVQIIAYELHVASLLKTASIPAADYPLASMAEMEQFFTHLQTLLIQLEFLKLTAPRKLMTRLRRLFLRARPDVMEMNILRGIIAAIETRIKHEQ
jgi:tRNA (cytidine32/uridine32-2'-O)-methyltransferase